MSTKGFSLKSVWNFIGMKGKNHSPVAHSFFNNLIKERRDIIKEEFEWFKKY